MLSYSPRDALPEVVVEERVRFEPKVMVLRSVANIGGSGVADSHYKGKISIVRNLSADTFNVEYQKMKFGTITMFPYLHFSINGNTQTGYDLEGLVNQVPPDGKPLMAHRSLLGDKKFHNLSTITLGYSEIKEGNGFPKPRYVTSRFTVNPMFRTQTKNIYSNFDKTIHLKTIKALGIERVNNYVYGDGTDDPNKEIKNTTEYNNIYLVPRKLNRTTTNKTMFDVYMNNDNNRNIAGDNRIISKMMRTTSFGKKDVKTQFYDEKSNDTYTPIGFSGSSSNKPKKIGRIDMVGRSFYDFEKEKSLLGNDSNSVDGEIIPYSLKGKYSRDINLSFNDTFKDMTIHMVKDFDQAELDPGDGKVKMKINEINKNKKSAIDNWIKLTDHNLKRIKKEDYSLNGLKRLKWEND